MLSKNRRFDQHSSGWNICRWSSDWGGRSVHHFTKPQRSYATDAHILSRGSATTVSAGPPWNMLGVLYDGAIEWSNGTKWRKQ